MKGTTRGSEDTADARIKECEHGDDAGRHHRGSYESNNESPSIFDVVPLPMLLPSATPSQAVPSDPGAFLVSGDGSFVALEKSQLSATLAQDEGEQRNQPSSPGAEFAEHPKEGLPAAQSDTDLAQARPISILNAIAAPQDDTKRTHKSFKACGYWRAAMLCLLAAAATLGFLASLVPYLLTRDAHYIKFNQMKAEIIEVLGADYFDSVIKEKALHWIVYDDPQNEQQSKQAGASSAWIQRFVLAVFYFHTSSQGPWASCNPPVGMQSDVCYYKDGNRGYEKMSTRWLSATHECQWRGVSCPRGTKVVTGLFICNNNLTGPLPTELSALTHLEELSLVGNNLSGSLPLIVFEAAPLQTIGLRYNTMTGSIPPKLFLLSSLTNLALGFNYFTGSIPPQIGQFAGYHLELGHNQLTGSIPEELYTATNLRQIYLYENQLAGTLSPSIKSLQGLATLHLSRNPIKGSLPSELGLLDLGDLTVELTNIGGSIPEEIFLMENLRKLQLDGNKLSSTISSRIGLLRRLEEFGVADNNLQGTLPSQLSLLPKLHTLHINGNRNLTGSIPGKFCSKLRQQADIVADCTPTASEGDPTMVCPQGCCTTCCDAETGICLEQ